MKFIFCVFFFLGGCAAAAADNRRDDLRAKIDLMVDNRNTDEQIAEVWGPPSKRDTVGTLEFWTYYRSYGSRSTGVVVGNTVVGHATERFDEIVLKFRDGVLIGGNFRIQR